MDVVASRAALQPPKIFCLLLSCCPTPVFFRSQVNALLIFSLYDFFVFRSLLFFYLKQHSNFRKSLIIHLFYMPKPYQWFNLNILIKIIFNIYHSSYFFISFLGNLEIILYQQTCTRNLQLVYTPYSFISPDIASCTLLQLLLHTLIFLAFYLTEILNKNSLLTKIPYAMIYVVKKNPIQ